MDERPDFGPTGYLPERAAKRARKIVLRAPLGVQWIVGALLAGVLVIVAGVLFLASGDSVPPDPWQRVDQAAQIASSRFDPELEMLIVTASGRPRAFADAGDIEYCPASNRLERADGGVWALTGRGLDGTPSLDGYPTLLVDGVLYVDPTRRLAGPETVDDDVTRGCQP